MTKKENQKLTLDQPATYQIKVPGVIDESGAAWTSGLKVTVEGEDAKYPITTLTGKVDQAALHGLLRRIYSHGLPLIAVLWLEGDFSIKRRNL